MRFDPYTYQPNVGVWFGARPFSHSQIAGQFGDWLRRASPASWRAIMRDAPHLIAPADSAPAGNSSLSGLGEAPGTSNAIYQYSIDPGGAAAVDIPGGAFDAGNFFSTWAREIMNYVNANAQSQAEIDKVKAQLAAAEQGRAIEAQSVSEKLIIGGAIVLGALAIFKATRR